ncbi:MAG: ATP-binding protein, partial [Syntrophales bacterium]|nr:ATP-binding protein [Syntrophales bacterium]
ATEVRHLKGSQLKLTILHRLIISYLLIIILVMISGVYTILNLYQLDTMISDMTADARVIRLSEESLNLLYAASASEEKYLVSRDPDYREQYDEAQKDLNKRIIELGDSAKSAQQRATIAEIRELHHSYIDLVYRIVSAGAKRSTMAAQLGQRTKLIDDMDRKLHDLVRISAKDRDDKLRLSKEISTWVSNIITVTIIIAVFMVILLSFLNTKSINSPISLLREKTKQIATGEYGSPLSITSPPEIRELSDAFNLMCERLKELDQMKLDFISHLSHELRTPLTAIREAASMLREGLFARDTEKQQDLYIIIEEECERLIKSVNRILDLSRLEAGMMDYSFQPFDLTPVIEKNVQKLSPIAERKKINVVLDLQSDLPMVIMDIEKTEEVLENLLSNALKFTPNGGKIIVAAIINEQDHTLEISVSDTGQGIPEEGLKEVFEKFKRVEDRKGAVRGTGLGLAIAKHIVDAHGGRIWAKSTLGEGSTFFFSLPLSG